MIDIAAFDHGDTHGELTQTAYADDAHPHAGLDATHGAHSMVRGGASVSSSSSLGVCAVVMVPYPPSRV